MQQQNQFNENYWNNRYLQQQTGWDLQQASLPLKKYIDQLVDKTISILIPGCGNAHEAAYLAQNGFTNITLIDIAPALVATLQQKLQHYSQIHIIQGDFFEHVGSYDLILEQTFFCAIEPSLRQEYVVVMHQLLSNTGKLVGVLFDTIFEKEGPPFGGSAAEYKSLFESYFTMHQFEACYNSYSKRQGTELFVILQKK
jgi:SAM-dependent methyltransferase